MRRLLFIEDDPDSLEMLTLVLEQGGYTVTGAGDATEAMRLLGTQTFDLVITDLVLDTRGIDASWQALAELVELARPASIGLITAWGVRDAEAQRHGVDFVLRKPVARETLFGQLAETLHLPDVPMDRVDIVRDYFANLEQRKFVALGDLVTDAVRYRVPGQDPRFAREVRGRGEFVELAQRTFEGFPEARFEIEAIRPLPTGALVEYCGRWREGEAERALPGGVMFAFRDNRISDIQVRLPVEQLS
jgi:CheY-like chemotaxis protein